MTAKPEAGEVIRFKHPTLGHEYYLGLLYDEHLLTGATRTMFSGETATVADLVAAGFAPAASLAAAETKADAYERAAAAQTRKLAKALLELASERAGREEANRKLILFSYRANSLLGCLSNEPDSPGAKDAWDRLQALVEGEFPEAPPELGPQEATRDPNPAPPSEGPKLPTVSDASQGGEGTSMVDQSSYDKGVYDAMHGQHPGYSCGYPNCERCNQGPPEGPASPVAEDYSRFELMSALAYDAIFRISSTLTQEQAGRSRAELVLQWQALRSQHCCCLACDLHCDCGSARSEHHHVACRLRQPCTGRLAEPPPASPPAQPKCAHMVCQNTPLPGSRRCYDHQPQRCPEPDSDAGGERPWTPAPGDRIRNYLSPTDLGTVQTCEPAFAQFGVPVIWDKSPGQLFYVSIAQLVRVVSQPPPSGQVAAEGLTRGELVAALRKVCAPGKYDPTEGMFRELLAALEG